MNLYICECCGLRIDRDKTKGVVDIAVFCGESTYQDGRLEICKDCWKKVKRHCAEMKAYFEDIADRAKAEDLALEKAREDMLDQHDCHASSEDGCACIY